MLTMSAPPTAQRRALLLGAPAIDLDGVEHDLELMEQVLRGHDFAVRRCDAVTSCQMDDELRQLAKDCGPEDVVVIYYSGHGIQVASDALPQPRRHYEEAPFYRFLLTSDIGRSTAERFCGYTNIELFLRLGAITDKTQNVALILDCCYTGRSYRQAKPPDQPDLTELVEFQRPSGADPVRSATAKKPLIEVAVAHYTRLCQQHHVELERRSAEANPHVIRLLASDARCRAYETSYRPRRDASPRAVGAMTLALADALREAEPSQTTWQDIGRSIRQTIRARECQRVQLEGPYRRYLFSLAERELEIELEIERADERTLAAGGKLGGLEPGDTLEVFTRKQGQEVSCGLAVVDQVLSSLAVLRPIKSGQDLSSASFARPSSYVRPRGQVELVGVQPGSPEDTLLRVHLGRGGLVQVLGPNDVPDPELAPRITLWLDGGQLALCADGVRFDVPRSFEPHAKPTRAALVAGHVATNVQRLVRAACLRRLGALSSEQPLTASWELEWHLVESNRITRTLAREAATLQADQSFTLSVRSPTALHLTVLYVHSDAAITLPTTKDVDTGIALSPEQTYVLGRNPIASSRLVNPVHITHPRTSLVEAGHALDASLVVVLTDKPVDLRGWRQHGVQPYTPTDPLEQRNNRNLKARRPPLDGAHYAIETISFRTVGTP